MPNSDSIAELTKAADSGEETPTPSTEKAVAAKMNAMRQKALDEEVGLDPVSDPAPAPAPAASVAPVAPAAPVAPVPAPVVASTPVKEGETEKPSGLPPGYHRAAIAHGWDDETIKYHLAVAPDQAMTQFERMFEADREQSIRWSRRGRELAAGDAGTSGVETPAETPTGAIPKLDAAALIENSGDEDLVERLVGVFNPIIDQINGALGRVDASTDFAKEQESLAVQTAVRDFLTSADMAPFRETYGVDTPPSELTEQQNQMFLDLHEEADHQISGAAAHGKTLSIMEALSRANTLITHEDQEQVLLQKIRKQMESRTKLTPSSHEQMTPPEGERELTPSEVEAKVANKMAEIRNRTST